MSTQVLCLVQWLWVTRVAATGAARVSCQAVQQTLLCGGLVPQQAFVTEIGSYHGHSSVGVWVAELKDCSNRQMQGLAGSLSCML